MREMKKRRAMKKRTQAITWRIMRLEYACFVVVYFFLGHSILYVRNTRLW